MEIYAQVKTLGKARNVLAPVAYAVPDTVASLRQLLTAVVESEVACYNAKGTGMQLIPLLSQQALENQARTGKVSFGRIWSDKKADPQKAVDNALQCFQDGLVRVFMGEQELAELDAPLVIAPGSVFTFIRLTLLVGSIW